MYENTIDIHMRSPTCVQKRCNRTQGCEQYVSGNAIDFRFHYETKSAFLAVFLAAFLSSFIFLSAFLGAFRGSFLAAFLAAFLAVFLAVFLVTADPQRAFP